MRNSRISIVVCLVVLGGSLLLAGDEVPDSKVNTSSGAIEIADPVWADDNYDIDYVINRGDKRPEVFSVSSDPRDDRRPRVAIAPAGDAWVAWWRDDATDQVLMRKRRDADGSWSAERQISQADESSRKPEVVHDGSVVWVAYEIDRGATRDVAIVSVSVITDEPDPTGSRIILGNTNQGGSNGNIDVRVHNEADSLWVTWVASESQVAWSKYDDASTTWSAAGYESYSTDDVETARDRVRTAVLGE